MRYALSLSVSGADCIGIQSRCKFKRKKSCAISLLGMENTDHLLLAANLIANLLVRLPHLMSAFHALHYVDAIFTPHRQRVFFLAVRANRTSNKSFTHLD